MVDEQKLRQLAEAATPGTWTYYADDNIISSDSHPTSIIALAYRSVHCTVEQRIANGTFAAAANPAAILSLLDELQALREERTAWRVTAENAEKDAARYRWIRFAALSEDQSPIFEALESANPEPKSDAEFDAAIDAAMKDES